MSFNVHVRKMEIHDPVAKAAIVAATVVVAVAVLPITIPATCLLRRIGLRGFIYPVEDGRRWSYSIDNAAFGKR